MISVYKCLGIVAGLTTETSCTLAGSRMSIVTVQLGQCGNQIGQELFNVISNDSHSSRGQCPKTESEAYSICSQERFFSEGQNGAASARAVLVDMEPKVISHTISTAAKSGRWKYGDQSSFCQKQGSGNNWANGFCVHGPRHEEDIMDLVRREVEKCDRLGGFFNMMSMAGGTGSGMGTYITQCLRDTYPHSFILNQVTWPYGTGEVIVQNYNSVLTLSHLYQSSDAILVQENDTVHKICAQLMNIKQISFKDVNKVIAHQLGSVLQPAYTEGASEYNRNPLGELMKSMVCHPEYKLLGLRNIPQMSETSLAYSVFTWPGLLKHLRQMLIANAKMEEGGFMDPALYTSWLPPGVASSTWRTPMSFNRYEKSATLVSNSQFLLKPLDGIVGKAWNMFASRAYVHQYTQFGISEEDFLDSFTALEQVIASYTHL
ncbi:tubulin delta chain-like isoform X5 [Acipenser ruthenus]|uniref:tubulin delta chain-like isoform X5 n=1 Tax=Acipenser ruthenus TaxID=7906 RepID=UPI002741ED81|nr:tubulin delta chain-like isoform X5 [Acipenser ruthenus]